MKIITPNRIFWLAYWVQAITIVMMLDGIQYAVLILSSLATGLTVYGVGYYEGITRYPKESEK